MDNFDFKKYLASGRIHQDHDQINEKKEDSKKGNKEEQKRLEGAIRDNRDHKFDIDKDEDEQRKKLAKLKKDSKKESGKGKKGNEDEQKRAEGAIKDAKDHKKNLNKDIKADEKKLAKLKKDFKKDVVKESEEVSEKQGYNDRDNEAIADKDGAESTKKMSRKGRRDISRGMEKALGNRPDSTDSKMDENQVEEYGKPIYDEDDTDAVKEQSSSRIACRCVAAKSGVPAKITLTVVPSYADFFFIFLRII